MCKKASPAPLDSSTKPKPLSPLNHFTTASTVWAEPSAAGGGDDPNVLPPNAGRGVRGSRGASNGEGPSSSKPRFFGPRKSRPLLMVCLLVSPPPAVLSKYFKSMTHAQKAGSLRHQPLRSWCYPLNWRSPALPIANSPCESWLPDLRSNRGSIRRNRPVTFLARGRRGPSCRNQARSDIRIINIMEPERIKLRPQASSRRRRAPRPVAEWPRETGNPCPCGGW